MDEVPLERRGQQVNFMKFAFQQIFVSVDMLLIRRSHSLKIGS